MPDTLSLVETGDADEPLLHAHVYEELRRRLITGKVTPGVGLSTRSLASELGVSQMPVRDALSRLAAEGAVQIRSKRKIEVPPMTRSAIRRSAWNVACCSNRAPPFSPCPTSTHSRLKQLRDIDGAVDQAMERGDVIGYMEGNFAFHSTLYRASERVTLNALIETLWLQFGPFMRVVYGRYGTANLDRPAP